MSDVRRRWTIGVLAAIGALSAFAWWQRGAIALRLVAIGVDRLTAQEDPVAVLPDGLHVFVCGAGSPLTDARHGGPCTVMIAGKKMFLFDAGSGSAARLLRMGVNPARIDAVFLTHFHSDHIDGVGELAMQRWIGAAAMRPLAVYGPTGVAEVVAGFRAAYSLDQKYRTTHHGATLAPPEGFGAEAREFAVPTAERRMVLIKEPDLEVVAFTVDHGPVTPAVGYRVRYKDRLVVLSGDTRRSDAVLREAQGADLLIHEALSAKFLGLLARGFDRHGRSRYAQLMRDIQNYHSSPEDAAMVAAAAKVRRLVLNHIVPPLPTTALNDEFLGNATKKFVGPIDVARDGDAYSLLPGTHDVVHFQRAP
ncbi:MAG: hypothetical protein RL469_532 [Pseudomonadota bacterium]|jgi:ribonuclease Z